MSTVSGMEYTLSEAAANYRRALEFGNRLLVDNFKARYNFYTQRKVEDARVRGVPEDRIAKWIANRDARLPARVERYEEMLADSVEGHVRSYVSNLKAAFGCIDVEE